MTILKTLIIVGVIIAVAIGGYVLYRSFTEDRSPIEVATELGGQLVTNVQNNPAASAIAGIGTTGGLTAIGGIALSKINAFKQTATEAQETLGSYRTKYDALNESVTSKETEIEALKTQLAEAKTVTTDTDLLGQYEKQITGLQAQLQSTQDQSNNFVKGLMQSANGALVTAPDGKIYSVLKVPPEVIVK